MTAIDFGLVGLAPEQESQLTDLLGQVRRAAGDFTDRSRLAPFLAPPPA